MNDRDDERLVRWLGATALRREPATLARALARVRAEAELPAWIRVFARPRALWTAAGLLCVSVALSGWLLVGDPAGRGASHGATSDILATLLGEDGTLGLPQSGVDTTQDAR